MPRCIHAIKRRAPRQSIKDSAGYAFGLKQSQLAALQNMNKLGALANLGMYGGASNAAASVNAFSPFDGSPQLLQGTPSELPVARSGILPVPTWAVTCLAWLRSSLQRIGRLLRAAGETQ